MLKTLILIYVPNCIYFIFPTVDISSKSLYKAADNIVNVLASYSYKVYICNAINKINLSLI